MGMRIVAHAFAIACLLGSGLAGLMAAGTLGQAETVFQELGALCFGIIAATLLGAAAIWVIVDQNERARREKQEWNPEALAKLGQAIEEIRDRSYDAVDRLDRIDTTTRQGVGD